jgi:hypothetical protein
MGATVLLPLRAEDIFRSKNPTALTGCEPENLGTKGQHATSRPPKLLSPWYFKISKGVHFHHRASTLDTIP